MKGKIKRQYSQDCLPASRKSRRTFLQSLGMYVAGLSLLPSSIFARIRNSRPGIETLALNPDPASNLLSDVILPEGVSANWDISKAYHETTFTRERICINGLWQWQPGTPQSDQVPAMNWGYFKVPGFWPGINNGMQKQSQRMFAHPAWTKESFNNPGVAWYRREINIPGNWINRRLILSVDYLNSSAKVFINKVRVGEMLYPAGELDLTSVCSPGKKYSLSIKVTALPLQDVVAIFNDSNAPRLGKDVVARRGLCGDVFLNSLPLKAKITYVRVVTSVRKGEITINTKLDNLTSGTKYNLKTFITDNGTRIAEFSTKVFTSNDFKDGLISVTEDWKPDKLWDIHTPQNMFEVSVSLLENDKLLLDTTAPQRFGFREFWIEGRDFYLNGTRIFLSAVAFDNAQIGVSMANYEAAKETMKRVMSFGINFVYTHNYGCEPGTHISFEEILRAADDIGMLIALSQPHFARYDWTAADAEQKNGYAHHARFYTHVAHNHPSVVFYSMNHNACGYTDDMNPDMIDGLSRPENPRALNNVLRAQQTEAIVAGLDPSRIIYHHSSGNLSSMHTSNFYSNWVPIQEMSDWFGHWASAGVKPLFLCEYGAPHAWDWGLYRGWYKGKREFGSALVPWEFCLAEWNSQFFGDQAYKISEYEKINLRWEAKKFRDHAVWNRNDYPYTFEHKSLEERFLVTSMHFEFQLRAFRSWGMSAGTPWNYSSYWKLRDGADGDRKELIVDWENLQRPGLSPDFIERANSMGIDIGFDQSDWIPTVGKALIRNNMPLLAYIGGKSLAFTSKDHNFLPGTKFEKQLIIINNTRLDVTCECSWSLNLPKEVSGNKTISMATGQQERIPLIFDLPVPLSPGNYKIKAKVKFSNGDTQNDTFTIHVLPLVTEGNYITKAALFDPKGETARLLEGLGLKYQNIDSGADLSGFEILIIGKEALTVDNQGLDVGKVRNGLKIIMFEQTSEVLEKRFGFRVQEYGLRQVFKRISDHPTISGLDTENLSDWQGAATLLSPQLKYEMNRSVFNGSPTVRWCDIPVARIWRCGNRGNVASVLIEKPASGNFLPIVDGGYSLQYSPLIEYREGRGMVMFCQMDVTGRTETDPAAERLARNIISYVSGWKPAENRQAVYAGEAAGLNHLVKTGVPALTYEKKKKLLPGQVLIVGPGGRQLLSSDAKALNKWITSGGHMLAIGLDQADVNALLPFKVSMKKEEHIAAWFETQCTNSFFAGIGPSDVHNRAPKEVSLVSSGAGILGNGVLANADNTNLVFCQLVPWQLDYCNEQHNVKQTYRRSSFLLNRLLGNLGVGGSTSILDRFKKPVDTGKAEKRWLEGLYADIPEEWDDPYRFFRW